MPLASTVTSSLDNMTVINKQEEADVCADLITVDSEPLSIESNKSDDDNDSIDGKNIAHKTERITDLKHTSHIYLGKNETSSSAKQEQSADGQVNRHRNVSYSAIYYDKGGINPTVLYGVTDDYIVEYKTTNYAAYAYDNSSQMYRTLCEKVKTFTLLSLKDVFKTFPYHYPMLAHVLEKKIPHQVNKRINLMYMA